ncbi:hypothetical protein Mmar10_2755 [Maricaulis maris MCS10]|uniref:Uncharacterized protein n=1 Tax=Maricaulis maris (strain MCS10) TaxID=394221 RepID=Q0AL02_MARMM|nr:hypothetical protein [Maricaulis maris]ABI67041.1 hypothetical protein Mmar10_2755 [Maricaulis maris MCS10]
MSGFWSSLLGDLKARRLTNRTAGAVGGGGALIAVTVAVSQFLLSGYPVSQDDAAAQQAETREIAGLRDRALGSEEAAAPERLPEFRATSFDPASVSVDGVWRVSTQDFALGEVTGRAIIDEAEQSAVVRLIHPHSGETYTLRSTRFERNLGVLQLRLEGEWPGAGEQRRNAIGEVIESQAATVSFSAGGEPFALNVQRPVRMTQRVIELEFAIDPVSLNGQWTQRWNAPRYGGQTYSGRQGDLSYADDDTGQIVFSGRETWSRLEPRIHVVVPLSRQMQRLEYGVVRRPHPDGNFSGDAVDPISHRTLLVIGTDLPIGLGEPVDLGSGDGDVSYALEMKQYQFASDFARRAEVGYDRLRSEVDPETYRRLQDMDAILVRADITDETLPGRKTLELNGAEGSWVLRFGDFSGRIDFARRLNDRETEATDVLLAPETMVVELSPDRDLKVESVDVVVFRGAEPVLFDSRSVGATTADDATRQVRRIPARRETTRRYDPVTGDEREVIVYRTVPLRLHPRGEPSRAEGWPIEVSEGDTLRAIVADPGVYEPRPQIAGAIVATSIAQVANARNGDHGEPNLTWGRALFDAYQCAEIEIDLASVSDNPDLSTADRLNRLSQVEVEEFSNLILLNPTDTLGALSRRLTGYTIADVYRPTWFSVGVSAGDHAAMLLLRDVFIDLMTEQESAWSDARLTGDALDGLRRQIDQIVFEPGQPIGDFDVRAPDGEMVEFYRTFSDDPSLKAAYGLDDAGLADWRRSATREAGQAYRAAIAASRRTAEETDACDVEGLLEMTAFGFGAVERQIMPRLMRPSPDGFGWEPDRVARSYVRGHTTLARAIQAQEDFSRADTDRVVLAAAIGGGLGAAAFGTVSAAWLAFAVDVGDLGLTATNESIAIWEAEEERTFARGATAVLGAGRYDYANQAANMQWFTGVTKTALGAYGAADSFVDAWRLTSVTRSVQRGHQRIAADLTPADFDRLERSIQQDVLTAIEEARRLDQSFNTPGFFGRGRGLTGAERTAYELGERLRERFLGRPSWADSIPARTYTAISDMRHRADIARLAAESPERFARMMDDPVARDLLRAPPNATTLDDLAQAVDRERRRIVTPISSDFYDDMAPGTPDPLGFRFVDRVFDYPGGNREAVSEAYIGQLEVGGFKRILYREDDTTVSIGMQMSELYDDAPTWVGTARRNLLGEAATRPGIPVSLYMNARTFAQLGVEFGDTRLRSVFLSNITNGQTAIQLHWLRNAYPDTPIDELLRYTHSYRYAETAITQAGFRVTGARIVPKPNYARMTAESLLGRPGAYFRSDVDWRVYLQRHGIEPDAIIENGHTFELLVEPFD